MRFMGRRSDMTALTTIGPRACHGRHDDDFEDFTGQRRGADHTNAVFGE